MSRTLVAACCSYGNAPVTIILGCMADQDAVSHYVGLDRLEAQQLAEREGREVADRSPHFGRRRADHRPHRVNVLLDHDGVVVMADLG